MSFLGVRPMPWDFVALRGVCHTLKKIAVKIVFRGQRRSHSHTGITQGLKFY